ncbi:MAG: hypothetical protein ACAF41_28915 [Leptolyngbya sp. BL-A-14]
MAYPAQAAHCLLAIDSGYIQRLQTLKDTFSLFSDRLFSGFLPLFESLRSNSECFHYCCSIRFESPLVLGLDRSRSVPVSVCF